MSSTDEVTEYVIPTTPGACVDKLYALERKRAEAQHKVDEIKKEYRVLEDHLLNTLPKDQLDGAIGRTATAKIQYSNVPTVEDWDKVHAYIIRHKAWDLMQKRLSTEACRLRWEDKKAIPGVGVFRKISLSLTKR